MYSCELRHFISNCQGFLNKQFKQAVNYCVFLQIFFLQNVHGKSIFSHQSMRVYLIKPPTVLITYRMYAPRSYFYKISLKCVQKIQKPILLGVLLTTINTFEKYLYKSKAVKIYAFKR